LEGKGEEKIEQGKEGAKAKQGRRDGSDWGHEMSDSEVQKDHDWAMRAGDEDWL